MGGESSRLKEVRAVLKLTQKELAESIGVKWFTIKDIEIGKRKMSYDIAFKLEEKYSINSKWLLTGKGEMFLNKSDSNKPCEDEYIYLPLLEGSVTAGPNGGILYDTPTDTYPFKRNWIERKFGSSPQRHKALYLFRVQGESMVPTVYPGEIALVDTWENERLNIKNGKIYLVRMPDGGITLKRVVISSKKDETTLVCISDNPNYEPFEFPIEPEKTILWYILGRIRWIGREID